MLLTDVIMGTIVGAILWPIVQKVVDATNRAVLGLIIGGLIGGSLNWATLGLYVSLVIGASIGANVPSVDADLGLVFLDAIFQTVRGAAIGAVIALSIRSISFVLTGAGIGMVFGLMLALGLRFLNQQFFASAITSTQMTLVVLISEIIFFVALMIRK